MTRKRLPLIFLMLGIIFLAAGMATKQDTFTYISIAFLAIAFFMSSRRPRRR